MATTADPLMEARADAFVRHQQQKAAPVDGGDPAASPTDSTGDPVAQPSAPETPAPAEGTEGVPSPGTEAETPTAPEGEPEPAPSEPAPEPTEPPELTDEDLSTLWEAYSDKFLETDSAKKRFQDFVTKETQRNRLEFERQQTEQAQVNELIQRGQMAYGHIVSALETAEAELGKAQREEAFDPNALKAARTSLETNLNDYGYAVIEENRARHNADLDHVVLRTLERLPPLLAEQAEALTAVVGNASRMYYDPRQSQGAFRYALGEMVGFLVDRAREQAIADERQRASQRTVAAKKIAESNATTAAAAKLAAQRGVVPPADVPASEPVASAPAEISQAYYEQRKKAGAKPEELDRITSDMARQAALGRRF